MPSSPAMPPTRFSRARSSLLAEISGLLPKTVGMTAQVAVADQVKAAYERLIGHSRELGGRILDYAVFKHSSELLMLFRRALMLHRRRGATCQSLGGPSVRFDFCHASSYAAGSPR